jgi:hypothetical protein
MKYRPFGAMSVTNGGNEPELTGGCDLRGIPGAIAVSARCAGIGRSYRGPLLRVMIVTAATSTTRAVAVRTSQAGRLRTVNDGSVSFRRTQV